MSVNVELINKIIAVLEEHPENFDMSDWVINPHWEEDEYNAAYVEEDEEGTRQVYSRADIFECGATCCIAGWAVVLGTDYIALGGPIAPKAQQLLGISDSMTDHLFYAAWPNENWFANEGIKTVDGWGERNESAMAIGLLKAIRDDRDPWYEAAINWGCDDPE